MKTIALSGWLAYAPFRMAKAELSNLGIELLDRVPDREDGLAEGRYAAAPLSTYSFAAEFERLGDSFGVHCSCVEPIEYGSDRIVVRSGIGSTEDLYRSRIGLRSQGLEVNLFEHLFDFTGLPVKNDYVFLDDRSKYISAFLTGVVDAVMAPQPDRSKLLQQASDAKVFEADKQLPRYGLYAVLVYNRGEWEKELLNRVHEVVARKGRELSALNDVQLKEAEPMSFEGVDRPAREISATLRWPSRDESSIYLRGVGKDSFRSHLRQTIDFRSRRFGSAQPDLERIMSCVN
jgi:hypothetical protein